MQKIPNCSVHLSLHEIFIHINNVLFGFNMWWDHHILFNNDKRTIINMPIRKVRHEALMSFNSKTQQRSLICISDV